MQIQITTHSANWNGQRLRKGQIIEMPDDIAKVFVATSQAVAMKDKPEESGEDGTKRARAK